MRHNSSFTATFDNFLWDIQWAFPQFLYGLGEYYIYIVIS